MICSFRPYILCLAFLIFSCATTIQDRNILKLDLVKGVKIGDNKRAILRRFGRPSKIIDIDKFFNVKNIDNWQYFEKDNKRLSFSVNRKTGTIEGFYWHFLPNEKLSLAEVKRNFQEVQFVKEVIPEIPHKRPKKILYNGENDSTTITIRFDEIHKRVEQKSWY